MYSDNLGLLYKSAKDAKLDTKLRHLRTDWDGMLDELLDEEDDDIIQLEEPTTALEFYEEIQLFRRSLAQILEQARDIVPNPSLYKFVHYHQPTGSGADLGSHTPSNLWRRLDSYLQDMPDDERPEGGVSNLISGWKRTLDRRDKVEKKATLGIGQEDIPVTTDDITQELSSQEQADLDIFDLHEGGGMVYLMPPPTQL